MTNKKDTRDLLSDLDKAALAYHQFPRHGKVQIQATKPLNTQRDLALAYSPGVAAPCIAIEKDPRSASLYTSRNNLVAVISNGTAVLGLGNIGPLASKPVMEGKAVLFKKFAGIDVFDIEIDGSTVEKAVEVIAALEPTFGGINLEDIKAPECFYVEQKLRERMKIPVFHDDQHGTAIIVAAAVLNGLKIANKKVEDVKLVTAGAGAAALACLNLLVNLGIKKENIWVCDMSGLVYEGREESMDPWKSVYAQKSTARTLAEVMDGADIFLGLSAGGVLKRDWLMKMSDNPLILALANPTPEIMPEEVYERRPDAMVCTGRSDYPNQVNNVLCFPYIFRGALDVEATKINEEMKLAAVHAIAALAREPVSDVVSHAYSGQVPRFGPNYLIPSPFDPRLILRIAPAVAKAAMETGVALRPIEDIASYAESLNRFIFRSGMLMRPVFSIARASANKRVVYAEGENSRILRAIEVVVEEKTAHPILIGSAAVIQHKIDKLGLTIRCGEDFEVKDINDDASMQHYITLYQKIKNNKISDEQAREDIASSNTLLAALMVLNKEADGMICGLKHSFLDDLTIIKESIGVEKNVKKIASLSLLISNEGALFLTDCYVNEDPSAEELVEIILLAAQKVRDFGLTPRVTLVSHTKACKRNNHSSQKMQKAVEILSTSYPDLEVDVDGYVPKVVYEHDIGLYKEHDSKIANLLVFPNLDVANMTLKVLKQATRALHVGPILLGQPYPAHILTESITSRGIINMTAIAVLGAKSIKD